MFILYSALLVRACSVMPNSLQPHYAPLSVAFSRQESWSGLPFPTPGYLPYPGIEPTSPVSTALASGFYTPAPPGKPRIPTGLHQINAYSENLSLGCAFFKLSVKNVCCCFKKKKKVVTTWIFIANSLYLGGTWSFIITVNFIYHFTGDIKIIVGNLILSLVGHISALQIYCYHTAGLEDGVKITVEPHNCSIISGWGWGWGGIKS